MVSRENGKNPFSQVTDAPRHGDHLRFRSVLEIFAMSFTPHVYKVRRRKDHRGVDLISDVLSFGRRWYGEPSIAPAHIVL